MNANGSGVKEPVDVITALRRAAKRPRTAQGWVHVGPALLEEAAYQLEAADQPTQPVLDLEGRLTEDDAVEAVCRIFMPEWKADSTEHTSEGEELWDRSKAGLRLVAALLSDSKEKGT